MRMDFASQISWQTLTPGLLSENSCIRPAFASDTYLLYGSGAGLYFETAAQRKAPTKDSCEDWRYFLRSWCSTFLCTIKRLSVCQTQLPLLTGKRTLYVDIVDIMRYLYTPATLTRRPIPLFLVFLLHLVFLFIPYPLFPLHRLLQNL
jgi:hypothetical protein